MTWFRRLVIGITEFFLVISIFVFTILSGIAGGFLGGVYFTGLNATSMQIGSSHFADVGTVVGSILGGLIGFTTTATTTAMIFAVSQIERNTRSLIDKNRTDDRNFYDADHSAPNLSNQRWR
jgi:hypothetical protein